MTPTTRKTLSKGIGEGNISLIEKIANKRKIPHSSYKEARVVSNYLTMEPTTKQERLNTAEAVERKLFQGLPLTNQLANAFGLRGLEGGKRKTLRKHKRRGRKGRSTRKQTIPPAVVEGIELLVEAGGARQTRKNVKRR